MSFEDDVRKELENREREKKEKSRQLEAKKHELELQKSELSSKNQALLSTLGIEPTLVEIQRKYWDVGIVTKFVESFNQKQLDFLGLSHFFDEVHTTHEDYGDGDTYRVVKIRQKRLKIAVGVVRVSDSEVNLHFSYNGDHLHWDLMYIYEKKTRCAIINNNFVDIDDVKAWVTSQIKEAVIRMTKGDPGKRSVLDEGLRKKREEVRRFKEKEAAKEKQMEAARMKADNQPGCWSWFFN